MAGQTYKDLVVWQKAMDLVEGVYLVSRGWPAEERYGLGGQVQRAAVSIPANLAKGQGRDGLREFLHHTRIANGSLYEVETHLAIAARLGYLDTQGRDGLETQTDEVGRFLQGLMRHLRSQTAKDH